MIIRSTWQLGLWCAFRRGLGACLAAVVVFSATSLAYGQTSRVRGGEFREEDVWDESLLNKGRFEIGFIFGGTLSSNSITTKPAEAEDGQTTTDEEEETSSQILSYVNILAQLGYMATDMVEVRFEFGLRNIHNEIGDTTFQNTWALSGALQGLYHYPLWYGTAWYGGLGAGGFYGWTNRPYLTTEGGELKADIATSGFLGEVFTGLLMQPGPTWILRGGLRFEAIIGFERPEDESLGYPDQDFTNLIVMVDAGLGWRI